MAKKMPFIAVEIETARKISKGIQEQIDNQHDEDGKLDVPTNAPNSFWETQRAYVTGLRDAKEVVDGYIDYTRPKKRKGVKLI